MWAEEVTEWISDNDAVENKIKNHIKDIKQKINKKLIITAFTIIILLDEWIN